MPEYPFLVSRTTGKKVGHRVKPLTPTVAQYERNQPDDIEPPERLVESPPGFLPVYVRYRNNGSRITTEVRRISGDVDVLAEEIRKVCYPDPVRMTASGGNIEVKNNHTRAIKMYLASLGF